MRELAARERGRERVHGACHGRFVVRAEPGSYTLWMIPTARGDTLIISKQIGQWGTQYDVAQDLLRIPVSTDATGEHVEQLTISVEPEARGGKLVFSWERRRLSAAFTIL